MNVARCQLAGMLAVALALSACAVQPDKSSAIEAARAAYGRAANDPQVAAKAPVALANAEDALNEAEQAWQNDADAEVIDHQAYLAEQRAAIATERAKLNAAEDAVREAEAERKQVLLQARTREAEQAKQRAEERAREAERAQREAQLAREEAEAALARANELASRVQELEAKQTERGLVLTLGDVLFDYDKAELRDGGERAVTELSSFLEEYPERNVLIEGFTDSQGAQGYNQDLSQRRAQAVQAALMEQGIGSERLRTRGYGEEFPVASNDSSSGRQQNRRVEIIISDQEGNIPERSS